jgi:Fic family protein
MNMLAGLQQQLVLGTRGDTYDSGKLRQRQVYIGPDGCRIQDARFVPCPPGDRLIEGVSAWEKWINAEDNIPLLVKVALGHYQFESLHPFSDGNGRLGRLVAILQLVYNGALTYPLLNLSPWIEPRRAEYQELLLRVSQTGQFDAWVRFFCEAVRAQSADAVVRIDRLNATRVEMTARLKTAGAKGTSLDIVEDLLGYPVITARTAAKLHNVSYQAANQAISRLVGLGILREFTGRSYGRVFMCDAVVKEIERL